MEIQKIGACELLKVMGHDLSHEGCRRDRSDGWRGRSGVRGLGPEGKPRTCDLVKAG